MLDARRAVADDEVELLLQLFEDPFDSVALQGVLVAGLRGWKYVQIVVAFILDQRLVEVGVAVDDIDEIKHDAALAAHPRIEVAHTYIEIDTNCLMSVQRK